MRLLLLESAQPTGFYLIKKQAPFCFIFLIFLTCCKPLKTSQSHLHPLLSNGFEVLKEVNGDLNFDNNPDHAVVLSNKISETEDRRKLLIFLKNKNGKVIRVFENDSIVFGTGEGGFCCPDPFGRIEINNGKFSVIHMSGDCWRTSTALNFQFDAKLNELYFAKLIITEFYACKNTAGIKDMEYTVANPELRRIKFSDYTGQADLIYRNNYSQ